MRKETIARYLAELGSRIHSPCRIIVGGSSALILREQLQRHTEDIDVVDEVPEPIRGLHAWRDQAQREHGLYLAHFQSHYLPRGWEQRVETWLTFRRLEVGLVDSMDIAVGKLFSKRAKDLGDLRDLQAFLTRDQMNARLAYADRLAANPELLAQADHNYYCLWGEDLPAIEPHQGIFDGFEKG